jgi:hypothetical protein
MVPVLIHYLQNDVQDQLVWKWLASGQYSPSTTYKAMFIAQSAVLGAKELWKVKALGKCLFFAWLVLHGRCYRHQSGYNGMVFKTMTTAHSTPRKSSCSTTF